MNRGFRKQLSPKTAALAILVTIVAVQVWWWQALVAKHVKPAPPMSMGPMPMHPGEIVQFGRESARVTTIGGAVEPGYADGALWEARFDRPAGLAIGPDGAVYVADSGNDRIRCLRDGKVTTLAGSGPGMADGPAGEAKFLSPCGVAVAADGTVYVADTGNNRIRRIAGGQVTTAAGSVAGFADGTGPAARFHLPTSLVMDGAGRILVADTLNRRIRTVTPAGSVTSGPDLGAEPLGVGWNGAMAVTLSSTGGLLVPGARLPAVPITSQVSGGVQVSQTMLLGNPGAICAAPEGWLMTDASQCALYLFHDGKAEVLAGVSKQGGVRTGYRDAEGNRAGFTFPMGIAVDARGRVWVGDTGNNCIRRVTY